MLVPAVRAKDHTGERCHPSTVAPSAASYAASLEIELRLANTLEPVKGTNGHARKALGAFESTAILDCFVTSFLAMTILGNQCFSMLPPGDLLNSGKRKFHNVFGNRFDLLPVVAQGAIQALKHRM